MKNYSNKSNARRAASKQPGATVTQDAAGGWIVVAAPPAADVQPAICAEPVAEDLAETAKRFAAVPAGAQTQGVSPEAPARRGKRAGAQAAAEAGLLPSPPDFSAPTHKPYRAKLAALVALVQAGDIEALRAYAIKLYSTSPRALARYRDHAVAALAARGAK